MVQQLGTTHWCCAWQHQWLHPWLGRLVKNSLIGVKGVAAIWTNKRPGFIQGNERPSITVAASPFSTVGRYRSSMIRSQASPDVLTD